MKFDKIETKKEGIEELKKFYISMYKQKQILLKKKNKDNMYLLASITDKEILHKLEKTLNDMESDDEKIQELKGLIDDIFSNIEFPEIKEKLDAIGKEYYEKILEKIKETRRLSDEEVILKAIDESDAKIYEDKSINDEFLYGDLSKVNEEKIQSINYSYEKDNKKYNLYPLGIYEAYKIKKDINEQNRYNSNLEKQYIIKYLLELEYIPGKIVSMEFFGDLELEKGLECNVNKYFLPMLAAVSESKKEGNEYIGKISCIFEEDKNSISTFIRTKDQNLENAVKILIEKEKNINKKLSSEHEQAKDTEII